MKKYSYGADESQFGHLYKPQQFAQALPVVVVIHGGYWKDNHTLDSYATKSIVNYLKNKPVAVWNIEYRRMEFEGENTKAPWPAVMKDVAVALDFLRQIALQEPLDLSKLCVIGHSAGGHLATWAASRANLDAKSPLYCREPIEVHAAMSIGGVLDLQSPEDLDQPQQVTRLLGSEEDNQGQKRSMAERCRDSNPAQLGPTNCYLRLIHGAKDEAVGVKQAHRYLEKADEKVDYTEISDADHFSMLPHEGQWQKEHWKIVKQQIDEMLQEL